MNTSAGGSGSHVEELLKLQVETTRFVDEHVSVDSVRQWIDRARHTASHDNVQPWRFAIITDEQTRVALSTLGRRCGPFADAPVVVIPALVRTEDRFTEAFDLGRVSQSLILAAVEERVGSCVGVFEGDENVEHVRQLLSAPDDLRIDLGIGLGHWPRRYSPVSARKTVDELLWL